MMIPLIRRGLFVALACLPVVSIAATAQDKIRNFAESALRQRYAQPGSRVETHAARLDSRLQIGDCSQPLSARLPDHGRARPRTSVLVRCMAADGWSVRVPVQLEIYRKVLVASRPLIRGDGIIATDVHAEERDITRLGYGYIENLDQVASRALSHALQTGSVLTPSALGGRRMVRAGDHVQLLAEMDGIEVRAQGVALGSGDSGARLRVRNGSSGRVVDALVKGPGKVIALP